MLEVKAKVEVWTKTKKKKSNKKDSKKKKKKKKKNPKATQQIRSKGSSYVCTQWEIQTQIFDSKHPFVSNWLKSLCKFFTVI